MTTAEFKSEAFPPEGRGMGDKERVACCEKESAPFVGSL